MREEDVDKLLKEKIDNEIKTPENLKNRISYEIKNMKKNKTIKYNKKTKLRVIESVAAVAVFSILGVTTYATVTKNPILERLGLAKGSTTYEEVAKDINQDLSNEYANITLKRIASDSAYIIMEYQVKLKEKGMEKFGNIEEDNFSGYKININNNIKISDKKLYQTGYTNKISDTEYEIYQIIDITNIDSKELNMEIEEKYLEANYNQTQINKKVIINVTKKENKNILEKIESKTDNKTIKIENFQNTGFETFIKVSIDIDNINKEDIDNFYSKNNPNNNAFTIIDNNGNYIPNHCYQKVSYIQDNLGNKLDILYSYDENNNISFDHAKAHVEYIITLGDIDTNINNIKLLPYVFVLPNERTEEINEHYDNLKWYKLQDGNYSKTSTLGGKIEITKIETSEDKIKFYYNLSGCITGYEEKVILRINDEKLGFNVINPSMEYTKKISSEENYSEFDRNTENTGIYSYNFKKEEDYKLKDLSKIEFALLVEPEIYLMGEGINLSVPKEEESYFTINKVEIEELKNINQNNIEQSNIEIFNEKDNELAGIKLGMTEKQVKNILGEPKEYNYLEDMTYAKKLTLDYENILIILVKENGEYLVTRIELMEGNEEGPRKIKIGDTKESVINKFYYDKDIQNNDETILYSNGERISAEIRKIEGLSNISYYSEDMALDIFLGADEKVRSITLSIIE